MAPEVILGADTICLDRGEIIGKAGDAGQARKILRRFSACEHEVLTGVAILRPRAGVRTLLIDRARVRVGVLGERLIERYLRTGLWRGKAGAYNLFERLDAGWPITYEGDPTTIVGLPMEVLAPMLGLEFAHERCAGGAA